MYVIENVELEEVRQQWKQWWKNLDAWWLHGGSPVRPHVELTSGNHSNGFFNCGIPAEETIPFQAMVTYFCENIQFGDGKEPTWVIGPAMGAIGLSRAVSFGLGETGLLTRNGWADKVPGSESKEMVIKRHDRLGTGDRVIVVEDVTTTLGTIKGTMDAIRDRGASTIGVLCVLNRSPHMRVRGLPILSLVRQEMPVWTPEECPLCQQGSRALRPKEGGNWARLTA